MSLVPKPLVCPVCSGKLRNQYQAMVMPRRGPRGGHTKFRKRRRVCLRCKIAVVVQRLRQRPQG